MTIRVIGIDLGKNIFHLAGMDEDGQVITRKRLSRSQVLTFMANLPACVVGMEACCSSHWLGKKLREQGHEIRLIPAQFVRPFVKSNKNDAADAEAIAEAVQRPTMRFVPIKTEDQLDLQAVHRVRERLVARRTAVVNQVRALLLERGLAYRQGRAYLRQQIPAILEDAEPQRSPKIRWLLHLLWEEGNNLEQQIDELNQEVNSVAADDAACQRLLEIPGVGPQIATTIVASVGNGSAFRRGRDFAAWLGLVPRQHSTGGRPRLLGISKRGNSYLRKLFVHGARAVITRSKRGNHPLGRWIDELASRVHHNVLIIALANKLARISWALLNRGETYRGMATEVTVTT